MSAAALLPRLAAAGVAVWAEGANLRLRGRQPDADLLAEVRAAKADLLLLLAANDVPRGDADPPPAPESACPPAGRPERTAIDATNTEAVAGLQVAGHRRPAFAPDPEAVPPPGSACPDCNGQTWLLDLVPPADWVCAGCFPSEHAVHLLTVINTAFPARAVTEPGGDDTAPLDGMGESEPPTRRWPPPVGLIGRQP